jgi:opacity protein-like surface antigen
MKKTLLVAAAALLGATAVQAAEPMSPGATGAAGTPSAPTQSFGASPGVQGQASRQASHRERSTFPSLLAHLR